MPSAGTPYLAVEMGCARTILVCVLMDGRVQNANTVEGKSGEMDVPVRNETKAPMSACVDLKTGGFCDSDLTPRFYLFILRNYHLHLVYFLSMQKFYL